jgi:sterol desaturase/sphingolipid hydroxylase (fatty acid hydroxylase superfamily)
MYDLPNLANCMISLIPTCVYFTACSIYEKFVPKIKDNERLQPYFDNSSKNMISAGIANIFLVYPLFSFFEKDIEIMQVKNIVLGCLMIDTIEYFWHALYHNIPYMYSSSHSYHHKPFPVYPRASFYNHDSEAFITSSFILCAFLYFSYSYYEYIVITALSYWATVCDHTNTDKNKFHILHHNGNKNTNFQQPFFTFWDHLFGTYNPESKLKIPFIP